MIRKTVVRTMLVVVLLMCATMALAQVASAADAQNSLSVTFKGYTNELRPGATSDQVDQYQGRLIHYGYLKTGSGVFDNDTIQATRYFQAANKITVNGIATAKTRTLINKDTGVVNYATYETAQQTAGFKPGAFGLGVAMVQSRLKDLGYYDGPVSGKYTSETGKAVITFKKYNNFNNASGIVSSADREVFASADALTRDEVYGDDTIKPGASGDEVLEAQVILREMGYYKGTINGKYGREMIAAVKKMQKAYKLYPTGWLFSTSMAILDKSDEKGSIVNARAYAALDLAQDLLGKKYKLGTAGPSTFDCSGFTYYVFKKMNITLAQNAAAQSTKGKLVAKRSSLQPGDLVFFATGKSTTKVNHVGIVYDTDDGNVKFVHASSARGKVITSAFNDSTNSNFYAKRFRWARRMW